MRAGATRPAGRPTSRTCRARRTGRTARSWASSAALRHDPPGASSADGPSGRLQHDPRRRARGNRAHRHGPTLFSTRHIARHATEPDRGRANRGGTDGHDRDGLRGQITATHRHHKARGQELCDRPKTASQRTAPTTVPVMSTAGFGAPLRRGGRPTRASRQTRAASVPPSPVGHPENPRKHERSDPRSSPGNRIASGSWDAAPARRLPRAGAASLEGRRQGRLDAVLATYAPEAPNQVSVPGRALLRAKSRLLSARAKSAWLGRTSCRSLSAE